MQTVSWLLDAWARELAQVLEMMTAQSCRVVCSEEAFHLPEAGLWWKQSFSNPVNAPLFVGASPQAWSEIGSKALQAAGIDLVEQSEARSTYLEILRQSLTGLTGVLRTKIGGEVEAIEGTAIDRPPATTLAARVQVVADGLQTELVMLIPDEFVSAFGNKPLPAQSPPAAGPPSRIVDFLLDVELPVSISFGHAKVSLKDLLKLTTGSVVELDRQPEEPVDVIVNNAVVARGEVVVVDGNYGVRVNQIVSRQQRLALRTGERVQTRGQ